jgi:bifunctional DNA-binding transcriptional regulator/antitoxin component of YhaV-PrlF toxin-antitoxin module
MREVIKMAVLTKREKAMDRKIISVSPKRQITIPLKYFEELNINNEVECLLKDNSIIIRPLRQDSNEFSEEILKELISQGLSGKKLLEEFKKKSKEIKGAIRNMLDEAEKIATGELPSATMKDIFGTGD